MWFDLVRVRYKQGCKEICKAPPMKLSVGDEVETAFGRGIVEETFYVCEDDKLLKFFLRHAEIEPVIAVINKIIFEEPPHDLPKEPND